MIIDDVIKQTHWTSDGRLYVLVKLGVEHAAETVALVMNAQEPFCALLVDRAEVTLALAEDVWLREAHRLPSAQVSAPRFRLITFQAVFDFDVVGFMARISTALAAANVPIMPFAAYSTDHLLIPAAHFDNASAALDQLGLRETKSQ
jgi:hypothetical protein